MGPAMSSGAFTSFQRVPVPSGFSTAHGRSASGQGAYCVEGSSHCRRTQATEAADLASGCPGGGQGVGVHVEHGVVAAHAAKVAAVPMVVWLHAHDTRTVAAHAVPRLVDADDPPDNGYGDHGVLAAGHSVRPLLERVLGVASHARGHAWIARIAPEPRGYDM